MSPEYLPDYPYAALRATSAVFGVGIVVLAYMVRPTACLRIVCASFNKERLSCVSRLSFGHLFGAFLSACMTYGRYVCKYLGIYVDMHRCMMYRIDVFICFYVSLLMYFFLLEQKNKNMCEWILDVRMRC